MIFGLGHADRMCIVLRDRIAADVQLGAWANTVQRLEHPQALGGAGPIITVSVAEVGVQRSDGQRCSELVVVLSVGLEYQMMSDQARDDRGSAAAVVERLIRVIKAEEALQETTGAILSQHIERIEQVVLAPLELGDAVTLYRSLEVEYRSKIDGETWIPVAM